MAMPSAMSLLLLLSLPLATVAAAARSAPRYRPVVLMHGINSDRSSMANAQRWIEADFAGVYVFNAEVGDGRFSSWFMPMDEQVDAFARAVAAEPRLADGFNLVCHSQGGLVCRGFVERYNKPRVHNFITWSSMHAGLYGLPNFDCEHCLCPNADCPWLADGFSLLLEGRYAELQHWLSFAAYWRDPLHAARWTSVNTFLADLNNLRGDGARNATYRANLASLNALVLQYSDVDRVVIPQRSAWWEFFADGSEDAAHVVPLNASAQYRNDWTGLRTLDERGALHRYRTSCPHGAYPDDACHHYYVQFTRPWLNNTMPAGGSV